MVPGSEEQEVWVLDEGGQKVQTPSYKITIGGCNVLHDNIIDLAVWCIWKLIKDPKSFHYKEKKKIGESNRLKKKCSKGKLGWDVHRKIWKILTHSWGPERLTQCSKLPGNLYTQLYLPNKNTCSYILL